MLRCGLLSVLWSIMWLSMRISSSTALWSVTLYKRNTRHSLSTAVTAEMTADAPDEKLHPSQLHNGTIPYPKALSPSSIMEFQACPQSFLFQYLYNLRPPTNAILTKGSLVHKALEQIYSVDRDQRTLDVLQNLLRHEWSKCRKSDTYSHLFEDSLERERIWGQDCLRLLENYIRKENPMLLADPVQRETWVKAQLSLDPRRGVTAAENSDTDTNEATTDERFLVRGIIDRIDLVKDPIGVVSRIVDYKTGKAPHLKYSRATNQQILNDKFFQLKIYALLLREMGSQNAVVNVRYLRLFHLTNHQQQAETLDFDLGATQEERDAVLNEIHEELSMVWHDILEKVSTQNPLAFPHCDRSFCYCHTCRARFVPGTVYERGMSTTFVGQPN